jgi:transketolase
VPGIDFSTGSLGQGPALAAGAALAARMQGSERRAYALISDAELNEGSVWEAVMFAAHHRLGRLTIVIDLNGQQAFGYTQDVLDTSDVAARFSAFGWEVSEVDGHDHGRLREVLDAERSADGRPHVVIARTTFGKGVSFMESKIEWHYLPLSQELFTDAMAELDREPEAN